MKIKRFSFQRSSSFARDVSSCWLMLWEDISRKMPPERRISSRVGVDGIRDFLRIPPSSLTASQAVLSQLSNLSIPTHRLCRERIRSLPCQRADCAPGGPGCSPRLHHAASIRARDPSPRAGFVLSSPTGFRPRADVFGSGAIGGSHSILPDFCFSGWRRNSRRPSHRHALSQLFPHAQLHPGLTADTIVRQPHGS